MSFIVLLLIISKHGSEIPIACLATNLNYILSRTRTKFGESFFCFWVYCLEQSVLVRQIVTDSDWLQTQLEVSHIFKLCFQLILTCHLCNLSLTL